MHMCTYLRHLSSPVATIYTDPWKALTTAPLAKNAEHHKATTQTALAKHILVKDAEITVAKKAHDEAATVYNQQIAEKDEKLTAFKESTD